MGLFAYIWLILMANVDKYTSPMGPMGLAVLHVEISRLLIVMWSLPAFIASSGCLGTFRALW